MIATLLLVSSTAAAAPLPLVPRAISLTCERHDDTAFKLQITLPAASLLTRQNVSLRFTAQKGESYSPALKQARLLNTETDQAGRTRLRYGLPGENATLIIPRGLLLSPDDDAAEDEGTARLKADDYPAVDEYDCSR